MIHEEMTVHQALCARKILENRIRDTLASMNFVSYKKHGDTQVQGIKTEDFVANCKADYQSLKDLMRRYVAIKNALVVSNATTKVTVLGVEYTVAEVIEMLRNGVNMMNGMISTASSSYKLATRSVEQLNATLDTRADNYVVGQFGNADKKNISEDMRKARQDYVTNQTVEIVDPLKVVDIINSMTEFRDKFKIEADSALSVSNATTKITIEYGDE